MAGSCEQWFDIPGVRFRQFQRLVEVSDRMVEVILGLVGFAADVVRFSILIEPNCFVGVGDRAVVIALAQVGFAAPDVRVGVVCRPDLLAEVCNRPIVITLAEVGKAAVS
jgi:hypothetical protein